jgi:hypothetical protein
MNNIITGKTKYFEYTVFPDQSYIYIKILPSLKCGNEMKILPLSDVHVGANGFDEKKLDEYIKYINDSPVLCYLGGDMIENALSDSPSGVFDQVMKPREQMFLLREKLEPIKDKILFSEPGNHEERTIKRVGVDPLEWVLRSLDEDGNTWKRYFAYPLFATIEFNEHKFNFFVQHGASGSTTPGGKINAASRPMKFIRRANFLLMGHVHSSTQSPQLHLAVEMEKGKMIVKEYVVYVIISPAFYKYFGTYAARKSWPPPAVGAVVPYLWKDGSYGASS